MKQRIITMKLLSKPLWRVAATSLAAAAVLAVDAAHAATELLVTSDVSGDQAPATCMSRMSRESAASAATDGVR